MTAERYLDQVDLRIRVIPEIGPEGDFALKGGTAINLFVRDLPGSTPFIRLTPGKYLIIRAIWWRHDPRLHPPSRRKRAGHHDPARVIMADATRSGAHQ